MMLRLSLSASALLACGCVDLQPNYDNAARAQCREITNQFDRQECLARVEDDARARREERRTQY